MFTFETEYDRRAMTAMARVLRRTVRRGHSRRTHIFGWIVAALAVLLVAGRIARGERLGVPGAVTVLAGAILVAVLLFEDRLNGALALKRTLPATRSVRTTFGPEGYTSETALGTTQYGYDAIQAVAETEDYFVFLFSASHVQVYDKRRLTGGTADQFRAFLQDAVGKTVSKVD